MPFLDWVNKNQAKDTTREVPYHLLKRERKDTGWQSMGKIEQRPLFVPICSGVRRPWSRCVQAAQ